jgi:glycosyltransferase involved in cell wall biosynthesis
MKPEISIVIPAFNEEDCIEQTLLCFKNQKTKVPFEVIVCDNNSSDKTREIAKKYAKVISEKRQGIGYARNNGTKHSKGEYLVHADADTIYPPNFIDEVYKIFKTNKYAGFGCGVWDYYDGKSIKSKILTIIWSALFYLYMTIQSWNNKMALAGWCICTPRKIFNKVGGFITNKNYLEDLYYGYYIEYLGNYGYFPNIRVRSSTRRFDKGLFDFIKHYEKLHAPISVFIDGLFRKRFTKPYKLKAGTS